MGRTSDEMEMGVEQNKAPEQASEEPMTASKEEFETGVSVPEEDVPSDEPVPGGVDPDVVTPRTDQNTSEADLNRDDIDHPVSELPSSAPADQSSQGGSGGAVPPPDSTAGTTPAL